MASSLSAEVAGLQRRTVHLPNNEAYDLWAPSYDSDGNILQALDSLALKQTMFPRLLDALVNGVAAQESDWEALHIVDLGCGTGRATLGLLEAFHTANQDSFRPALAAKRYQSIYLTGLDSSPGMLKIAEKKVPSSSLVGRAQMVIVSFQLFDIFDNQAEGPHSAHAIISTLVLEHIPLKTYFERAKALLKPNGLLLLTNMHPDMANSDFSGQNASDSPVANGGSDHIATGAGFIDATNNTKIRGKSYAHTIRDVDQVAQESGFERVGSVQEMKVQEWMLKNATASGAKVLLSSRGEKWVGTKCWFGMILRSTS